MREVLLVEADVYLGTRANSQLRVSLICCWGIRTVITMSISRILDYSYEIRTQARSMKYITNLLQTIKPMMRVKLNKLH